MGDAWKVAKELLQKDILSGKVSLDAKVDPPRELWMHGREECRIVDCIPFRTNLNELRKKHRELKAAAETDSKACVNDMKIYKTLTPPKGAKKRWDGAEAQACVKELVEEHDGLTGKLKPLDVWESNLPLKTFPPKQVRRHVCQEEDKQREAPYWLQKKAKKSKHMTSMEKEASKKESEDCEAYLASLDSKKRNKNKKQCD